MPDAPVAFDQFVEYVTEGPVFHQVVLSQHALQSAYALAAVGAGYVHAAQLGRAILAGTIELAMVFSEWSVETGLPDAPGIVASAVLAGWPAKSVAVAYAIANSATLDAINANRTAAIALIRMAISADNGPHPLAPGEPFTAQQVGYVATWINQHGITNTEFAALFDVTPVQLSAWLQNHPRVEFARVLHKKWSG